MRKAPRYSKTVFDTLLQAYRPFLYRIGLTLVLGFLGRFLILSNAQMIGRFIDQHSELTIELLQPLIFNLAGLLFMAFVFTFSFRIIFSNLSARAVSRIYDETTYRVSRFPVSFFDHQPVGKITTRFSSDYGNVFRLFGGPLAEFLSILFDLTSIVIILFIIHPLFLVTVLVSSFLYFFILKKNQFKLRESRREVSSFRAPSIAHFSETVQGATIIRQNNRTQEFTNKFLEFDQIYLNSKRKVFWHVTRFSLELNLLSTALFAVNAFVCLKLISAQVIGVGQTGVVLSFTLLATYTLQMFFEWFSQFEEALTGVEKMDEYIRHPLEPGAKLPAYSDFLTSQPKKAKVKIENKGQPLNPARPESSSDLTTVEFDLQVENLNFRYPSSDKLILKNLSFKLKPGHKLGIVGRTGSGKSTLIAALLHLYPIESGVVLVRGRNETDVEEHRRLFSVISQDQLFLSGTVRDNLDLFRQCEKSEIEKVLHQVGLDFPLDMNILEKGQNLSQGEKQLLSLARGLLQKSKIFIFDEATSNVDPLSENLMNKALQELLSDKTQIRIAHRLQTVEDCDQVLWIDDGEVKKWGATKEVLEAFSKRS